MAIVEAIAMRVSELSGWHAKPLELVNAPDSRGLTARARTAGLLALDNLLARSGAKLRAPVLEAACLYVEGAGKAVAARPPGFHLATIVSFLINRLMVTAIVLAVWREPLGCDKGGGSPPAAWVLPLFSS